MTLPPLTLPKVVQSWKDLVRELGAPCFDAYYEPPIPPRSKAAANLEVTIGDQSDIKRLLLMALGHYALRENPQSKSGFLLFERTP